MNTMESGNAVPAPAAASCGRSEVMLAAWAAYYACFLPVQPCTCERLGNGGGKGERHVSTR